MRIALTTLALAVTLGGLSSAEDGPAKSQKEVEQLRDELKKAQDRAALLAAENKKLRDAAYSERLKSRALAERVKRLEAQLEAAMRGTVKGGVPGNSVSGEVASVSGGLITVGVGSDGGLAKGQELEVYRPGASPKYLGRVVAVEVRAKASVVKPVGRLLGPVQKGDQVGSRSQRPAK